MHRSSESMASLATALAKAQIELVNPEKSLTANIRCERRGGPNQTFRYAPLSSGLDIIRKTLGRHEIAVMQTTAVDSTSGLVNLTTLLAHTSGEWISSDWPVCPIADTATPHRMGSALTYARRYALFALVGIAGEDDSDAPDLDQSLNVTHGLATIPGDQLVTDGPSYGSKLNTDTAPHRLHNQKTNYRPTTLDPHQSARSREQLLTDIATLPSLEEAAIWAKKSLPIKNTLLMSDATLIERAFDSRLAALSNSDDGKVADSAGVLIYPLAIEPRGDHLRSQSLPPKFDHIDRSLPFIATSPRRRHKAHLKFVAAQACLVCGREPSDPHHLRFAQPRALGRKVSDEFTVPLCRSHHRELHRVSDEPQWWSKLNIDPMTVAQRLWRITQGASQSNAAALKSPQNDLAKSN